MPAEADEKEETASKRRRCGSGGEDEGEGEGDDDAVDEEYFRSYDDLSIHALMLGDAPRVGAYLAAMRCGASPASASASSPALEGRVVLDVGAGSGILSMLAARKGGASKVYAVEAAPGMASLARELVARNGLGDAVQVIEGRIEDLKLPEKVDAIVSEWMGFYLVHESMLESVLVARERWLKPGGLMLPNSARIWASPVEAEELRREIDGYGSMHGLDLSPVGEAELARRLREPQVELVAPDRLLASPVLAVDLGDLGVLKPGATREFAADVSFVALRAGHAAGVALWFDVGFGGAAQAPSFSSSSSSPAPSAAASSAAASAAPVRLAPAPASAPAVLLDTAPGAPATHWKQTVVYLGIFAPVEAGDVLSARLTFRQSDKNPRQYDITVET